MDKRVKKTLYKTAQWTWGLPQTLLGAGLYALNRKGSHFDYGGAKVTEWDKDSGISLGRYIFVPSEGKEKQFLLEHEYGHSIQSLMLGPAYLLLVGLPSVLWNRLPYFERRRKKTGKSYYSAVFERTASELGKREKASDK